MCMHYFDIRADHSQQTDGTTRLHLHCACGSPVGLLRACIHNTYGGGQDVPGADAHEPDAGRPGGLGRPAAVPIGQMSEPGVRACFPGK
jgi:hypothetical protein